MSKIHRKNSRRPSIQPVEYTISTDHQADDSKMKSNEGSHFLDTDNGPPKRNASILSNSGFEGNNGAINMKPKLLKKKTNLIAGVYSGYDITNFLKNKFIK